MIQKKQKSPKKQKPPLERPVWLRKIRGCKRDCGHTREEHIAFDWGVHDGHLGLTVMPAVLPDYLEGAWRTGLSVGRLDHPRPAERDAGLYAITSELDRAYAKHGRDQWSRHEFYGIIKEELDELWEAIRGDAPQSEVRDEAIQVAAMVLRYLETGDRYLEPAALTIPVAHPAAQLIALAGIAGCAAHGKQIVRDGMIIAQTHDEAVANAICHAIKVIAQEGETPQQPNDEAAQYDRAF